MDTYVKLGYTLCKDEQSSSTGMYAATPGCDGKVYDALGGGIKCNKCNGWFCF